VIRDARLLLIPLALHTVLAIALWTTGSMHGTWTFECGVGAAAWELAHGGTPHFGWSDYYDSWTSGYLLWALLEAPLTWLPWDPIYAVKAISLGTTWAVGLLAFGFLREVSDRRTALLGSSALILGPPALWYHAQLGGNYHYTELVPCLALFWRLAVWTKSERWSARAPVELGLLAGLAVTTSIGSALPVALAALALVVLRPDLLRRSTTWLAAPAGALGAAPLLYKALLHQPFGQAPPEQEFSLPYAAGGLGRDLLPKLTELPARLADHVGFAGITPHLVPADLLLALLLLAVAGLALFDLARLPRDRRAERLLPALPGLYVAGLLVIYLLLPTRMPARAWTGDLRAVRFLPPLLAAGVMAAPLLLARLRRPRLWPLALVPPALGLVGCLLVIPWSDVQPRLPQSGRCHLLLGMYAGKTLPPSERPELCDGFGDPDDVADCQLGRATAPAVYASARGELRAARPATGVRRLEPTCLALPEPRQRACFRQIGWVLAATGPQVPAASMPGRIKKGCSHLHSTRSQVACREGLGYWFADHVGAWPERLELVVGEEPPQVQRLTATGAGARLGWALREEPDLVRACAAYEELVEGGAGACLEGARSVRP